MTWQMALFTYLNVWVISLFGVLPFRLGMKRSLLWNTGAACIITLGLHLLLRSGWIPLRHVY